MFPVIDLHCDTLYRLASAPNRFYNESSDAASHITFSGLCSAGTVLQCFALFTDLCEAPDSAPTSRISEQVACFQHILADSDGHISQIRTSSELTDCIRHNRIGALLTLEESCLSENPISLLPDLYSLGVRIATLTWDYSTLLGTSAVNASPGGAVPDSVSSLLRYHSSVPGLSPYGFDFIAEAERLGIILDVSHLSDAGFYDLIANSHKPFLASHSNARSVCDVPRNLSDDMLRILGERGGLTGLCLHEPFLTLSPCSDEDISEALAKHVMHILSVAGSEVLALGTDFDGTPGNRVIPNVSKLSRLEDILKKAGLTSDQIDKIFYRNALRFLKENLP